jgi:hypothetical protein
MTFKYEEFEKYLVIDKNRLDDELVQQASLMQTVSDAYADALAKQTKLKEALAKVDAEIDVEIRNEAADTKLTETMVRNQVILSPGHIKAFNAWLDAKLVTDKLEGMKDSFKQRSYNLRELSNLFVANYYEANSTRGDSRTDEMIYKRRRARLAEGREKRKQE